MGTSVSAPAPNPELEQAQIESMRQQMGIGRAQQAFAQQMQPLQEEQLKFGIDASKTAYEQTQADRQYALAKRDQYDKALGGVLNEAQKFDEASRRNELGQQAAADVSRSFSVAQDQQRRQMARSGVNPVSGRAIMADQSGELAEAAARANASRMVSEAARQEGLNVSKSTAGLLAGAPAMAASLSPSSARLGWGGVDQINAGVGGINQGFGVGSDLYGAAGKNAYDMYNAQENLYTKANVSNINTTGELWGSIAGAATKAGTAAYLKGGGFSNPFSGGGAADVAQRMGGVYSGQGSGFD